MPKRTQPSIEERIDTLESLLRQILLAIDGASGGDPQVCRSESQAPIVTEEESDFESARVRARTLGRRLASRSLKPGSSPKILQTQRRHG
jgi:hypothetical protein